jgi:hypothetical protein
MALRITKTGLEAIDVEDEATDSCPAEARELVFSGDLIVFVVTSSLQAVVISRWLARL